MKHDMTAAEFRARIGAKAHPTRAACQSPREGVVLGVDPGATTGLALVDRDAMVVRDTLTVPTKKGEGWWAAQYRIAAEVKRFAELHRVTNAVVQTPINRNGTTRLYKDMGKRSPVSTVKNAALSHYIAGMLVGMGVAVTLKPSQECSRMKEPVALWCARWGWTGTPPSEHARDAANLTLEG